MDHSLILEMHQAAIPSLKLGPAIPTTGTCANPMTLWWMDKALQKRGFQQRHHANRSMECSDRVDQAKHLSPTMASTPTWWLSVLRSEADVSSNLMVRKTRCLYIPKELIDYLFSFGFRCVLDVFGLDLPPFDAPKSVTCARMVESCPWVILMLMLKGVCLHKQGVPRKNTKNSVMSCQNLLFFCWGW